MRAITLFSAGLIAMAIRPEMYPLEKLAPSIAITWMGLFIMGLVMDITDCFRKMRKQ